MTERLHFHFSLSCIGEGNGNPLQCSCLENPRDGGAWWAAIYGVTQSQTRLKRLSSSSSSSLISLLSKELSRVFSNTIVQKLQFFGAQPSLWWTLTSKHDYWKNHSLTIQTFVGKVMSLLFNTLSTFVIAFLPRNKRLLISWLQSPSAVILEPKKIKSLTVTIFPPIYLLWHDETRGEGNGTPLQYSCLENPMDKGAW